MAKNDGGPAMPTYDDSEFDSGAHALCQETTGMSLLDWFAGKALAGILQNSDLPDLFKKGFAPSKAAEVAYECGLAMLAEKAKRAKE